MVTSVERVQSGANARMELTEADLWDIIQRAGLALRRTYRPAFGMTVLMELEVL